MRTLFLAILALAMLTVPASAAQHVWIKCTPTGVAYYVGDTLPTNTINVYWHPTSITSCAVHGAVFQLYSVVTPVTPTGSAGALSMIAALQRLQSLPTESKAVLDTGPTSQNRIETIRVNPTSFAPAVRKVLFPTP